MIFNEHSHAPIFTADGNNENFVPLQILSNTAPILDKALLIGVPLDSNQSKKRVEIIANLTYYVGTDKPNVITIARPLSQLQNLSHDYQLSLEIHNVLGGSRFPLILKSSADSSNENMKDRDLIIWILLSCALVAVFIALGVLIFKSYRYVW